MYQAINTCITGLNNIGQVFWDYAAGLFIQVSVLIVLLLLLDFLLRKRVRAVFRYCLWMLLFVKLVLPASFTLPTGIGYWLGDYFPSEVSIAKFVPQPEETSPIDIYILPQGNIASEIPMMNETAATGVELASISREGLLFLGWLAGMSVLLAFLVRRIRFLRRVIAQSRPANERSLELLEECRRRIGIDQNVELRLTSNTFSPAVCGFFKPIILIPSTLLKKLSKEKLMAILIHELAHIKRGDGWMNLLQVILQIVYFYNPFVWIANAMVRRVREQAVDEMVLVTLRPATKSYSNMLIDIAEMAFWRPNFSLQIIGVVESKKALERRIKHMLNRPVPKSAKLGCLGLIAIVVIGTIILPMGHNHAEHTALATPMKDGRIVDKLIVPGVRVGKYTFDMSKDDILERLGKPKAIFYSDKKYTLDNLPRRYFMVYDDISFGMHDDSVKGITALSPDYKFANGLRVGDSEKKVKKAFGKDFSIKKSKWKDFLFYKNKGLMFEISTRDRTVMEINVSPIKGLEKLIVPGVRVGDYTFDMSKDDVLQRLGKPKAIFYGDKKYTPDNPPEHYYMPFGDICFRIFDDSVREITTNSPDYKFANGVRVGDSEKKVKKAFGKDFSIKKSKWKDFLSYKNKGLMFEINKKDRTVMEINVRPIDDSKSRRKSHIPATSTINEEGRIVDKTDYPFFNDPKIIGGWKSVDFVREIEQFNPKEKNWKDNLYLNHLIFEEGGKMPRIGFTWTKGLILSEDTASKYIIKEMDGSTYMFFEWKSGDYTIRHRKPSYYVLRKVLAESLKFEPIIGKKAYIPPTSIINEQGRIVDKTDYPFVNDTKVIGGWKSVDFVHEMKDFNPKEKNWKGDLHLNHLIFEEGGNIPHRELKWTKSLVLSDDTASKYTIKEIDGSTYMFYEWKSGDYTIRYMKPYYYVLKKVSTETLEREPMYGKKVDKTVGNKAHIPATSTINEEGHIVDKLDYPFVNDSKIIGTWKSVDFVGEMEEFKVRKIRWRGGKLYLKGLIFHPNGKTFKPWWTWTKGLIFHSGSKTASKYTIKDIKGSTYMFYEWKSGDYTIRHRKPSYYVLKKVSSKTSGPLDKVWTSERKDEKKDKDKSHIPATSTINKKGHIVDKIDYPFVDDPRVIGLWKSVDYVDEIKQFKAGRQHWKGRGGELFFNEMMFDKNGRLTCKNDKVPGGYDRTWTKGLVISDNYTKTASKYTIKEMDGSTYLFYEWKSGDYTFRHSKPTYYVLKKVSS